MVNLKRLVSDRRDTLNAFIMSQVTSTENSRSDASSIDPTALADVSRMAGYVDICAKLNARKLARNPIHLYRPARRGRQIRGRQAAYLTGKSDVVRGKFNEQVNTEEGYEIVTEHPALEMLRGPNPYLKNGTSLRFVLAYSREITGNSYAAFFEEDNRMYAMNPAYTRIIPNEDEGLLIDRYVYGRDTSEVMYLSPSLVHHQFLEADFRQPYKGVSWLHSIGATADLWRRIEEYLSQLMLNHGRPDVLIHFEGHMDAEKWEQAQKGILGRMRRAATRAAGVLLTNSREGVPTVHNLGHAPKDVESIQLMDEAERTICNAAGIPETIMRMSDSNLASARTGEYHWCSNTIMPRAVQEADEWTAWLHENYPDTEAAGFFFAPENCVPDDVERADRFAVQGWQGGILTRNEARALAGYEPAQPNDEFLELQPAGDQPASDPLFGLFGSPRREEPTATEQPKPQQTEEQEAAENLAEGEKLNGAQIEAALLILQRITEGTLARGAAIELLVALGIDRQRAVNMVDENRREAEPVSPDEQPIKAHDPGDESDHDRKIDTTEKPVDCCDRCCDHDAKVWSQSEAYAKTPDSLTGEGEREFAELRELYKVLVDQFQEQMTDTLAKMDDAPMGLKGAHPRRYTRKQFESFFEAWGLTNVTAWAERMNEATGPIIRREFAKRAIESLRLVYDDAPEEFREQMPDLDAIDPEEWIIEDTRAAKITRRFADRYAESMMVASRTTAERLANTLSEGLEAGEGLNALQDRVRASFLEGDGVTISESRAARIARTEVAQAQTEGRIAGMAGSNVVKGYRFDKAVGACPICDAVEKEVGDRVFGIEESIFPKGSSIVGTDGRTFKFDYQDTIVPIHPNCRCAVKTVLIDL